MRGGIAVVVTVGAANSACQRVGPLGDDHPVGMVVPVGIGEEPLGVRTGVASQQSEVGVVVGQENRLPVVTAPYDVVRLAGCSLMMVTSFGAAGLQATARKTRFRPRLRPTLRFVDHSR